MPMNNVVSMTILAPFFRPPFLFIILPSILSESAKVSFGPFFFLLEPLEITIFRRNGCAIELGTLLSI